MPLPRACAGLRLPPSVRAFRRAACTDGYEIYLNDPMDVPKHELRTEHGRFSLAREAELSAGLTPTILHPPGLGVFADFRAPSPSPQRLC